MFVNSGITALYIGNTHCSAAYVGDVKVWPTAIDYLREYLTIEIVSAGTIVFSERDTGTPVNKVIEVSVNNCAWTAMATSASTTINVAVGDKIRCRGNNTTYKGSSAGSRAEFVKSTAIFNLYGNIMSLIYGDNFIGNTTLNGSFRSMFEGTNAVDADNLIFPALVVPDEGYMNMFMNCYLLEKQPTVLATEAGNKAFQGFVAGCTKLKVGKEIYVTKLNGTNVFQYMYQGDTALETVTSTLPATSLTKYCYSYMFNGCSNLTNTPFLPASSVPSSAYYFLFRNCSKVNYIRCYATSRVLMATTNWVYGVSQTGTFVKKRDASWPTGNSGIPNGWTVIEED